MALPVVEIAVRGAGSRETWVRAKALLDPGSTNTFCTQHLARLTGVEGRPVLLTIETVNCKSQQMVSEVDLEVRSLNSRMNRDIKLLGVIVRNCLPTSIHDKVATKQEAEKWGHLRGLGIPEENTIGVELLIGLDAPHVLVPLEVRTGREGSPFAVRMCLGWTINGPVGYHELKAATHHIAAMRSCEEWPLMAQVKRLWEGEIDQSRNDEDAAMSVEDARVVSLWNTKVKRVGHHYELPIPFKEERPTLPNNREMVEKRLNGLKRRLARDIKLRHRYTDEVQTLLRQGYAETIPRDELIGPRGLTWYLPHHPVLNPSKPEKVRIVFDCAATYKTSSLNDRVLQGPDLNNKLLGVLLRFRKEKIAIMADVEAMFHQVMVTPHHRDALRFLWWKDGDLTREPQAYRMTVHLFGGVWSPSCAAYALHKTLSDYGAGCPTISEEAKRNFYVDDLLLSVSSSDRASRSIEHLRKVLEQGGFHLTKWVSNHKEVLRSVPSPERHAGVKEMDLGKDPLPVERALGVLWDLERDRLAVRVHVPTRPMTKRGLLGVVSSVYDPLGLVSPITIRAKMIFQEECRRKEGWDTPLLDQNRRGWEAWLQELPELTTFQVPRCHKRVDIGRPVSTQLHHFCDASQKAYGVASYLRTSFPGGDTHCSLVLGKAKLAPLKQLTIPRLELTAAVLAAKLDRCLREELDIDVDKSIFWTDSNIVLQYINNTQKRFRTFVANRIALIRKWSTADQWRHVNTSLNPADDASRGLTAKELKVDGRWTQGPRFLWQEETEWPERHVKQTDLAEDSEVLSMMTTVQPHGTGADAGYNILHPLLTYYSSWYRLLKGVAWLRRCISRLKGRVSQLEARREHQTTDPWRNWLSAKELQEAKTVVLEAVQRERYGKEMEALKKGKRLQKKGPIYQLEPFIGEDGLIHVGGRLDHAPLTPVCRYPTLLPRDHGITEMIIWEVHEGLAGHSGREHTLAMLRQEYWVPSCRRLLDKVIKTCVICKRNNYIPKLQRQAPLPSDRVMPGMAPFTSTGVDCFGPFLVKLGRKRAKRWGCLFTCMATRAVHLEVLMSLDTDAFLNAVARFAARRGFPAQFRSDNGTNMVGAEKELRTAMRKWENDAHARGTLLRKGVEWIFNPPKASHMGGVWERQIRTIRKVMRAIVGGQVVDDDRLSTLFCEAEAIVNSRPLTPVSEDPNDLQALTPNQLLRQGGCPDLPLGGPEEEETNYRKRWKHAQYLANQFWKRWLGEYLPALRQRRRELEPRRNLQVGEMVIVADPQTPRRLWSLGRILETSTSSDGLVRQVTVQTAKGEMRRPINKLCPLELHLPPPGTSGST